MTFILASALRFIETQVLGCPGGTPWCQTWYAVGTSERSPEQAQKSFSSLYDRSLSDPILHPPDMSDHPTKISPSPSTTMRFVIHCEAYYKFGRVSEWGRLAFQHYECLCTHQLHFTGYSVKRLVTTRVANAFAGV